MQFSKVTASKYIGDIDYSLRQMRDGSYSIFKGDRITSWGTCFRTVSAAETFINNHDYISASTSSINFTKDDIDYICETYGLYEWQDGSFQNEKFILKRCPEGLEVTSKVDNEAEVFTNMDSLLEYVDSLLSPILAFVAFRGKELRSIFAAKNRRSARDITQNLVRVKSSNVWAYGIEIKENDAKVGDVYIQFKGKNGGPDGGLYRYYDVPISTWRRILSHPSVGHAVWKYLRNSFYYSKLTGDKKGKLPNAIN